MKSKPKSRNIESHSEEDFLKRYDAKDFEQLSVAVDVVLLTVHEGRLATLVVRRDAHPYRGTYALPGAFVGPKESLDAAAARVLRAKAGLTDIFVEQLYTFGQPGRDPRTRVISVAYYALVDATRFGDRASATGHQIALLDVPWSGETGGAVNLIRDGEELRVGFDHADIIGMAVKRIRGKLDYAPIGFQLLPREFTLLELQRIHEAVLDRPTNKDSFRRRVLASGLLEATGRQQEAVGHRPAELYRFRQRSAL